MVEKIVEDSPWNRVCPQPLPHHFEMVHPKGQNVIHLRTFFHKVAE